MATTIKNLDAGTLVSGGTTTDTAGPTASSAKSWLIKNIVITNRDTTARGLDITVTNGAVSPVTAYLTPPGMMIPPKATVVLDSEVSLLAPASGNAEKVTLTALSPVPAVGTGLDWVVNGVERDAS